MAERLIDLGELLETLSIGRTAFYENEPKLKALGLQEVRGFTRKRLFRQASVDTVIQPAAEDDDGV